VIISELSLVPSTSMQSIVIMIFFCVAWASIPKVVSSIPTVARHIFQACPVWIHTQRNITNIIFTWIHNTNTEKIMIYMWFTGINYYKLDHYDHMETRLSVSWSVCCECFLCLFPYGCNYNCRDTVASSFRPQGSYKQLAAAVL
jgi:hypothetical protein